MTTDTQTAQPDRQPPHRRPVRIVAASLAGLAVVAAAVYVLVGYRGAPGDPACRPALETARRIAPLARGEVAAVTPAAQAQRTPVLAFNDASGARRSLADWTGRTVLLNLWATWCVPCRKEMPALAALEKALGGPDFEVVAINIDTRDPEKPKAWLKDAQVEGLGYYSDQSAKVFQDLKLVGKAFGMPTTLIVDKAGCEVASIAGPAEWASDDAQKLLKAALGR